MPPLQGQHPHPQSDDPDVKTTHPPFPSLLRSLLGQSQSPDPDPVLEKAENNKIFVLNLLDVLPHVDGHGQAED